VLTITLPAAPYPYDRAVNFTNGGRLVKTTNTSLSLSNFSVEAWIYPTAFNYGGGIISKGDFVLRTLSSGRLSFMIEQSWNWEVMSSPNNALTLNKWQHVAATYNASSKQMKIYVDGTVVATYTRNQGFTPNYASGELNIGYYNGYGNDVSDRRFAGHIDEVKVWNAVRTDAEIFANYATQLAGNETGLVAYYKFDQGVGGGNNTAITSLSDLTSNVNHLTPTTMTMNGNTNNILQVGPAILTTPFICHNATATLTHTNSGGTWSSSDTTIISINTNSGLALGKVPGTATITYTFTDNGCTYSSTKLFTVNGLPTITANPDTISQNLCINGTATALSVSATGAGLTYQWYKNTTSSTTGGTLIAGAIGTSYLPLTTVAGNAYYYCVVSGTCSPTDTSTISGLIRVYAASVGGTISSSLASICDAGSATLTLSGSTGTIQWQRFATPIWIDVNGETGSTYTTQSITQTQLYRTIVTNGTCSSAMSGEFELKVFPSPASPSTTTTINYCQGATTSALTATALSGYVLQWYTTATGGTASTSAPTPTSTATGTTTYYVSQKAIPSAITVSNYSLGTNQNWTAMNVGTSFGQTFSVPQNTLLTSIQYGQLYISTNLIVSMKLYSSPGGTLIATANNQINAGQSFQNNFVFSFANLNIQLNANQTYYFEISGNVANNMYVYPKLDVITGSAYKDGVANNSYDLEFLLSGTNVVNPCESPRTAITVNVNAIPTITGVQNMTVGGSTLQLTGSGTPNANSPWTSSSTSTATISATGEVTAVAGGSTIITYTNADGCSISQSITVVDCSQPLGNVLHFDGVNDYITTASNIPALNITADLTIETWIKFDQVHSDYVRLIGKGDANNRTYGLWLQTDGKLLFQINGTPTGLNFTSTTSLQPGIWYHIAAIRNGNSAKIFINGVEDATATTTVSPQTNTFPLTVGYGTIHNYLKGSLEDVRVWNIARTVSQIQQGMYNSIDGNETGLVAYYDFNQGIASGNNTTITTANDKSLNTLNATLTNFGKTGATSNFIGNTIVNFAVSGASIVCANSTSQFTHPRSGGTWSISNGASASINSSGLLTTLENENVTVSYTYTINGCSVTDSKSVSINTPAAPVVTTPVNLCQGVTATALTATASSGLNLLWYTAATGGTASNTAPIPTTTTIGATTYYVSQKATSGAFVIDNPSVYGYANYVSNIGQSFNVSSNVIVNSITLKEAFFDYSNANTVLKIYNGYGGALLATANSPYVNAYSGWNTGILFSFTNQNIILTSGQTYYFEIVSSSTMYPKYSNAYANGTGYINGGVISQDFAFKLDASINSNPCESPRTAIVVNVNAIPTITGVQNMTVGGATLQLTGSGTPNANTPWSSSNTAVATISATGEVTAVAGGTSVITYTTASGCSITTTVKVTDCAAPFGNALNFDGVNDYAVVDNVGNNSNLSFSGTSNFTIESWVKRENTNGIAMIFSKYNGGVAGNYWLGIDNTGKPIFSREASPWGVTATNTLPVNEWHHIAATYDGSQTKIYVDGVLNNTTSAPLSINHNISNIKVNIGAGLANNSPSYLFKGELDEIRVWNIARTATQIQQTYNATLQGNEAGLVAYYDFNHGIAGGNNTSVNTVVNTINIASNGTLTNFAKNGTISNFVASTIANFPINGPASICAYSSAQFTHQISGGTWSLASGAVATISNTGLITSSANENVTVSYTYTINGCSKTETKTVTIESPLISGLSSVGAGNTITLTASTTPASSNAWVSSNPAKATVSASGVVTGLATGTTIITFTNNNACTDTALITIVTGTTLAPTLTSPATNTTGATTLNIVYSLPEAPLAGSVTLTFTPVGGGTPIVWTMNNATSANFNYVVGTNPISSTVTAGVALGFTTYNVTLAYQDAFSNPPSSVTNLNIQTLAPPIISFVSSSYATVVNSTLTINTINTGGSMVTYSISPALPTGFTFNTTTGVITGSSTVAFTAINYTVTATNAAGTSTATVSIAITADTDGDGIPDIADADVNGDGVIDNGPDTDGDGIIDLYDNDIDGDGIPNNLDNDADGDGVPNSQDVCATIPNTAITAQPSTTNQVICPSATISPLTVTATGPGLSYQWYRNTTAATTGGVLLSGANSASYSPLNTVVGTAYYYVVVSGTCGTATSNVSGSILVTDVTLPTVVTQNRTIYLNASGQAAITAAQIDNGSTDNCSIATRTLNQTAFNCNNVGANTVTLTVTDVSGNIRTGNATVTVVDSIKPTVVTQNITVNLNASGQASITAAQINNGSSDNCGIASVTLNQTAFTCANTGANTVTLTVIDVNGNVKTKTATVTVVDNILPTVVTQNVIRYLNASGQATVTANDINNGSTDNCGIGTVALSQTAFTCAHVGVNTVTLSVTDTKGNTATGQATVTIIDNTPPTAIAQNINAYLNAGGAVTVTPSQVGGNSTDNCSIATMTLNNTTFNCNNLGANPVILTVVDPFNNVSTANAVITVVDSIKPLLTIPADITVNTNSGCGAFGFPIGTASATDNCSVISAITNNAPTFYPVGITNIVYSVTDGSGNTKTKIQKVTVIDNVIPIITAPASITTTLTAGCTKTGLNLGTPVTSDNCTIASVTNNAPTAFPVGTTTVTWTVTDASGNTATATQNVTVTDAINPTITAPANLTINANASCVAFGVNLGTPVIADNCTVASVSNNAPAVFPIGTTIVTWTVNDASGNSASTNQQVTVVDNTAPMIFAPAAITTAITSGCTLSSIALGTPITLDNCSVATISNNAPTTFPIGATTVTWTVTDAAGNSNTATQVVTIVDNTNPTIVAPASVTANLTTGCTTTGIVLGTPITADNCTVANVTNNAPATYSLGTTIVTWTVTDGAGNTATATQLVTISDNTNPTITAPAAIAINTTTGCTVTGLALGTPVTADNCTVASVTNNAPTSFPIGSTSVIWTVTDGSGNTATATQVVTVSDVTNPTITAPVAITVTTNSGCEASGIALGLPITADNCTVASVTNNAPATFPIGTTTVTWTVTDAAGNTSTATQTVTVIDNINPSIIAPSAVTFYVSSGCSVNGIVIGTPVTADNCTVASVTNNAPATFPIGSTTVTWTVTDGAGNSAVATQVIQVIDTIAPTALVNDVTIALGLNGTATVSSAMVDAGSFDNCGLESFVLSQSMFSCNDLGTNVVQVTITDSYGNSAIAFVKVTITPSGIDVDMDGIDDACDEFVNTQVVQVPSGFSPNGDKINDTFIIPALDQFTKVQLQVFNKYGHEVYVSSLYKNDWDGTSSFNGLELPDDTYFYILNTDGELRQGYVYINRIK
jgi:gliding motility-associated-like protein